MPRLKEVRKLFEICILSFNKAVLDYIDDISVDIKYGDANPEKNPFFLGDINPIINESLLHHIDDQMILSDSQKLKLLKLYRNNYLKQFNLQFKLPPTSGFYEEYLQGLNNLVVLNLTKVCTDEILKIVGENCPLLEVIYIVSKTESESNKSKKSLNALKLKFFVSDEGLKQLHQCKRLKKIYMDKIIRSSCGGRKITHDGLRALLSALPNLHYISYEDLGRVLEEWEGSQHRLNLIHIHDNHITPKHISVFSLICPSLQTLCLAIPPVNQVPGLSQDCLEQLSQTDLVVKNLVLKSFPFDFSLEKYIEMNGEKLTTLSLIHESTLTTQSLLTVGRVCHNLERLAVKLLHPSNFDYEIIQSSCISRCFKRLKILKLFGINWKPSVIFQLCVYNAKSIESITLFNKHCLEPLDEVFETLPFKNPLSNLTEICLLDGFTINNRTLINFVLSCKKLKDITFKNDSGYTEIFKEIIQQRNFDLTVRTDSISYGYCLCQN